MKYYSSFFLAFVLLLGMASCQTSTPEKQDNKTIAAVLSPADFDTRLQATPSPQLVDVRTPEEYNEGHLDNALNLNFYDSDFETRLTAKMEKEKPVFVYCKSGGRSGKTAKKLQKLGYKEVYDLKGGYLGWVSYQNR